MNPNPVHRLPAALESAIQRVKLAVRASTERTIESLGLAALASKDVYHRDSLLGAQFELNRKSAMFALAFNEALDTRVTREVAPPGSSSGSGSGTLNLNQTGWDALQLVDNHEMEIQVSAERFALEISNDCEWELRELDTYIVTLLGPTRNDTDRNPLRPEVVGQAMIRAVETVSERADVRKVLVAEFGRSLGGLLRTTYAEIIADLRQAGIQPAGLSLRTHDMRSGTVSGYQSTSGRAVGLDSGAGRLGPQSAGHAGHAGHAGYGGQGGYGGMPAGEAACGYDSRFGGPRSSHGAFGPSTRSGSSARGGYGMPSRGTPIGHVDPGLMSIIRRLAFTDVGDGGG
jgi:hypothetical protein